MRSVAKRQPQMLHHWLWLLMGLLMALTTVFVSRITWILTHTHSPAQQSPPLVHNTLSPKPHIHVAKKPSATLPPLWIMEDAPKAKTALGLSSKIKLIPSSPQVPHLTSTTATVAPHLHLAAFFKRSTEEAPKTIIPVYPIAEAPPVQAPAIQSVPHAIPAAPPPIKIAKMPPLPYKPIAPAVNPISGPIPGAMPLQTRVALINQHLQQGDYHAASPLIDRGLQQYPGSHQLIKLKALVLLGLQQPQAALTLLRDNAPDIKRDPDWYAFIAGLYQREGDHGHAVEYYQQVLEERPDRGNWWVGLAISQEALGQKQDALQSYRHAQEAAISPALAAYVNDRINIL